MKPETKNDIQLNLVFCNKMGKEITKRIAWIIGGLIKMRLVYLGLLIYCLLFPINYAMSYDGNFLGIIDNQSDVGYIAGNGMTWDFFIMFKLNKKSDPYRALSQIKDFVDEKDRLVAIGAYKNCVLLSLKSDNDKTYIYQSYSNASLFVSLCKVYTFSEWCYSKVFTQVAFNEIDITTLCGSEREKDHDNIKEPIINPVGYISIGTAQKIKIGSHQEEIWYSFNLPYNGFDLFFHTDNYSYKDIQNINITVFDTQLNEKQWWNSKQGSDGIRKRFYINREDDNEQYQFPKGKYLLKIENKKKDVTLIILMRKNDGPYMTEYKRPNN